MKEEEKEAEKQGNDFSKAYSKGFSSGKEQGRKEAIEIIEAMLKNNAICQKCGEDIIEEIEKLRKEKA